MSGRVDFFERMKAAASKTRGKSVAQRLLAVAAAGHRMRLVLSAIWIAFFALLSQARAESVDSALSAAIDGAWRDPQNRARDAYRHPYESLKFWGLKPGMTVVEVDPGVGGWWTEILAPYGRATGGAYVAALPDRTQSGAAAESPDAAHTAFLKGVADKSVFGEVKAYDFGPQHPDSIPLDRSTSFWWRGPSTTGRAKGTRLKPISAPFSRC